MIEIENRVLKAIKKDDKYLLYKKRIEDGSYQFNRKPYLKELDNIQITRKIRFIKSDDLLTENQKNLLEVSLQNQAIRSRIVEIKLISVKKAELLETHITELKSYIALRYREGLKTLYSTTQERNNSLEYLFKDGQKILNKIQMLEEVCDILLNDIDQASWSIKSIISILELSSKRETI